MKKTQRKLSPAEKKRKEQFDKICSSMEQAGYARRDLTFGVLLASIMAIVLMLPFLLLFGWLYFFVYPPGNDSFPTYSLLLFFVLLVVLIVVHELIHGLTWGIFAKQHLRSIAFGFMLQSLTPYCTCTEPLKKGEYILGCAMPTLILGFGAAVVAILLHSLLLFHLSLILILSGGGDFFIILKAVLHQSAGSDAVYYDHPYECGFVVFEKAA